MKHLDQLCRGAFFLLRYRRGFAVASQTTSLQAHKTTRGCRSTSCLVDSLSCSLAQSRSRCLA